MQTVLIFLGVTLLLASAWFTVFMAKRKQNTHRNLKSKIDGQKKQRKQLAKKLPILLEIEKKQRQNLTFITEEYQLLHQDIFISNQTNKNQ